VTLVARIAELIATDDDDQSERLANDYREADAKAKQAIDDAFICLCGYSLATLIAEEGTDGDTGT